MIWLIWSNGEEYGCCKSWDESWKAITALQRNGYEVWEFDMTDFRKVDFEQFGTLDLEELERMAILKAFNSKDWSQINAASLLGVSPRSINYKIKNHENCKYKDSQ